MPTLAQLDAARLATEPFVTARAIGERLTAAAQVGTVHSAWLEQLRRYVNHAVRTCNAFEMADFLVAFGPAFETTIAAAERIAAESERRVAA